MTAPREMGDPMETDRLSGGAGPRLTGKRVQDRFGILLVLLLASFVIQGAGNSDWMALLGSILFLAALLVGVLASGLVKNRAVIGGVVALGLASIALSSGAPTNSIPYGIASICAVIDGAFMLVLVLKRVLSQHVVTAQTLLGAASCYMLIGLTFAALYGMFDSFWSQPIFGHAVGRYVYGYFSFTTLSTVGYGDYTVKVPVLQRVAVVEAVAGQLFLATTVARLVSLYRGSAERGTPS
jgi:Ion channel